MASTNLPQSSSPPAGDPESPSSRRKLISSLVAEVATRRSRGETLTDDSIIAAHPELAPDLEQELKALRSVHTAFLAARRAGPLQPAPDNQRPPSQVPVSQPLPSDEPDTSDTITGLRIMGYTIEGEIGEGGQATVFRAIQDSTQRPVAIKVLAGGQLASSRHRLRFEREARILAKLDHPSIVGILDRGKTSDGSLYLVMPFIEGEALDVALEKLQALSDKDVTPIIRLFLKIAQAIAEAHKQGIIHRDIKPANIRIDARGEPHVLDFGLARVQSGSLHPDLDARTVTRSGHIVGSLLWASPEQVSQSDERIGVQADVYALGVMFYCAIAGRWPYAVDGSMREVLGNIQSYLPPAPSKVARPARRKIDAWLDAIVLRTLAKRPEDRYPSAAELAEDLHRYLQHQPPNGFRPPAIKVNPFVALTCLVSLVLGGTAWYWQGPSQPKVMVLALPQQVDSAGIKLLRLPRGRFQSFPSSTQPSQANASVATEVLIDHPFWIGETEVTQKQYLSVMRKLPVIPPVLGDDLPVQAVLWSEAQAFCRKLGEREKRTYRLPTVTEWQYACQGGVPDNIGGTQKINEMGWYVGNSGRKVHPVAQTNPNHFGLYDMHGNVAEWCQEVDPRCQAPELQARYESHPDAILHLTRGGGFNSSEMDCQSGHQSSGDGTRSPSLGFRVVREEP